MSVYIELVIFNNLAIDLMLICAVQTTRRRKAYKLRIALATLLGAVCATIYAVAPKWASIVIKILLAPLMALIFDKYGGENKRTVLLDYLKSLACFVCYTYLTGGVIYGVSYATGVDVNSYAIEGIGAYMCKVRCRQEVQKCVYDQERYALRQRQNDRGVRVVRQRKFASGRRERIACRDTLA